MQKGLSFGEQALNMRAPLTTAALLVLGLAAQSQPWVYSGPPVYSPGQLFVECAEALPRLYERGDFDSIAYHVQRRVRRGPQFQTDLFALRILLAIQRHRFVPDSVQDANLYFGLDDYVRNAAASQSETGFWGICSDCSFDARPYYEQEYDVIAQWARDLYTLRRLGNAESFLCGVFAGDLDQPRKAARRDRVKYWQINPMLDASFVRRREIPSWSYQAGGGVWLPQGKLARLGVHPNLTAITVGRKNWFSEWDFTIAFRFINTAHPYAVLQQDSLYSENSFFGGYIGIDYTRYLFQSRRFEAGPRMGIGIDGFDVGGGESQGGPPSPKSINSLNLNVGCRMNYYFDPVHFIGLAGRYNFIQYSNPGGTPLDGNAITIEVIVGFH